MIKNIIKYIFLIECCLFSLISHSNEYEDRLIKHLRTVYQEMISVHSVGEIEDYYAPETIESIKKEFKEKCGFKCYLGFDDWEMSYVSFMLNSNKIKREYFVLVSDLVLINKYMAALTLGKKNCNGQLSQEKIVYQYHEKRWLVGSIEFSSWDEEIQKKYNADIEEDFNVKCRG